MIKSILNVILKPLHSLKKRTFACAVIAILGTFFILAAQYKEFKVVATSPESSGYKAVIFDLGDVLFETSASARRAIFIPTILKNPTLLYYLMVTDIKESYFDILRQIPTKTTSPIYNKGKEMPQLLGDWMMGYSTLPELQDMACNQIACSNHPAVLKTLFVNVAKFMFDEKLIADSQNAIEPMVKLLQDLKTTGYQIYILSNWDSYSFVQVQKNHPEIFDYCDGVMISGDEKVAKPNNEIFQKLLTKYHLNPNECIFIDDEPYNIAAAKEFGITAMLHRDPSLTYKKLMQCKVMQLID